jgi:hypothetical protein
MVLGLPDEALTKWLCWQNSFGWPLFYKRTARSTKLPAERIWWPSKVPDCNHWQTETQ